MHSAWSAAFTALEIGMSVDRDQYLYEWKILEAKVDGAGFFPRVRRLLSSQQASDCT
jgi:hypothetical protein